MLLKFNLSPSSLNIYKESPLVFYFQYIEGSYPDTSVPEAYGKAGSVVHSLLENYVNRDINPIEQFEEEWKRYGVDNEKTLGAPLDQSLYLKAVRKGVEILNTKYEITKTEEKLFFPVINDRRGVVNLKGVIDCQGTFKERNGRRVIVDWKTSSSVDEGDKFRRQGLFYVLLDYLRHRKQNPDKEYDIPVVVFEYVKIDETKMFDFSLSEIQSFEDTLYEIIDEILEKGDDIKNYEIGEIDTPFNHHYQKCLEESRERSKKDKIVFKLRIFGNRVQILNELSPMMLKVLRKQFSYEVQDAYYIRQNSTWDGIQRLFHEKSQSVGIGFMDRLKKIFRHYAEKIGKDYDVEIEDTRYSRPVCLDDFPESLKNTELRPYQQRAVEAFMEKPFGILQLPTSSGKTEIMMEIIRRLRVRTLFMINRKELMYQTKERMEKAFGIPVGVIGDGEIETDKWVTVSTVQTLAKKQQSLRGFFRNVQFAICDETHIVATKMFRQVFSLLVNTPYRLGTSATAWRDDGNDMLIEENIGRTIFQLDVQELAEKGYIMRPTIYFEHVDGINDSDHFYIDDYRENIVENETRNNRIVSIVSENRNKKILVLTKEVDHGSELAKMIQPVSEVFHLHGNVSKQIRRQNFQHFKNADSTVMVATMSIASEGLDIPNLDMIINAGANKGDQKSIQILGRVLRIFEGKKDAVYWDFMDSGKYTKHHSRARYNALKKEGHEINVLQGKT